MTTLNVKQEIEELAKTLNNQFDAISLNDRQTSQALGVHVQTLKTHRVNGEGIPYTKLSNYKNGAVRYSIFDIAAYLVNNKIKTHNKGF